MKKFFVFLAGILSAIAICAVVIFVVYLKKGQSPQPGGTFPDSRDILRGTFVIPDSLKNDIKSGTGRIAISLVVGRKNSNQERAEQVGGRIYENPEFPLKFELKLLPNSLMSSNMEDSSLMFHAVYLPPGSADTFETKRSDFRGPRAALFSQNLLKLGNIVKKEGAATILELPGLKLQPFYPAAPKGNCLSDKIQLAGTVAFDPKARNPSIGKEKIALVLVEEGNEVQRLTFDSVLPSQLNSKTLHYEILDLSKGPVKFSFPKRRASNPFIFVIARRCGSTESAEACALKTFPLNQVSDSRLFVFTKDFKMPVCGQQDVELEVSDSVKRILANP